VEVPISTTRFAFPAILKRNVAGNFLANEAEPDACFGCSDQRLGTRCSAHVRQRPDFRRGQVGKEFRAFG
jgi:hypothetical protein